MQARKNNTSQLGLTNATHTCNNTKHISTCVDQTYPRPTKTQNVCQLELIKSLPCHREHKMYLKCLLTKVLLWQRGQNVCWRIHSHANMCWPKPPMTARPESASLHVLTIPFPCQRKKEMHLNLCWPIPSHASEEIICISKLFNQTHLMPTKKQNISQLVLTKPIPCQRGNNMYLKKCRKN